MACQKKEIANQLNLTLSYFTITEKYITLH